MARELRFFFDAGSGTCLWAANEAARLAFGYAISLQALPLSERTKRSLEQLVSWYDTSIDWQNPVESKWSSEESEKFSAATLQALKSLRSELPVIEYHVLDETAA